MLSACSRWHYNIRVRLYIAAQPETTQFHQVWLYWVEPQQNMGTSPCANLYCTPVQIFSSVKILESVSHNSPLHILKYGFSFKSMLFNFLSAISMRSVKGNVPHISGLHILHICGTKATTSKMVISDGTRMTKFYRGDKNKFNSTEECFWAWKNTPEGEILCCRLQVTSREWRDLRVKKAT